MMGLRQFSKSPITLRARNISPLLVKLPKESLIALGEGDQEEIDLLEKGWPFRDYEEISLSWPSEFTSCCYQSGLVNIYSLNPATILHNPFVARYR